MIEREIKLRFDSADAARTALAAVRVTPLRPRRLQHDVLFDTTDQQLQRQGCVLRLRHEGDRGTLTFKGRVQPGAMKVREERETAVLDAPAMRTILERTGFAAWFVYEKYREEYMAGDVIVAIDETPVGTWMELEGSEAGIHDVARALGRSPQDFILASYRSLFLERRADLALGAHMVFPPP